MTLQGWKEPENLEETAKRLLVPPAAYIRYRYRKELRKGEREIRLLPFLAPQARTALDIGANKGVYTYALLRQGCPVHAFEPHPKLFRTLSSWAAGRAALHQAALSDASGEAVLMVPRTTSGHSNQGASLSTRKLEGREFTPVTVEARRLDDCGISNVGFMKVDVEGFELEVLRGAAHTLRRDRPNLLVEVEEQHAKRPLAEMIGEICDYGYDCLVLRSGVLTPFSALDLARHTRTDAGADYIFNFVFLPR